MHLLPRLRAHQADLNTSHHLPPSHVRCQLTSPRLPLPAMAAAILARPRALQFPLALGTSPLLQKSSLSKFRKKEKVYAVVPSPDLRRVPDLALEVHVGDGGRLLLAILDKLPHLIRNQFYTQYMCTVQCFLTPFIMRQRSRKFWSRARPSFRGRKL